MLFVIQFIMTLVCFTVLAFILVSTQTTGGGNGAFFGFLFWLGLVATEAVGGMMWEKKPFKLALIQSTATLVNLVIGGAIIGAWR